jgi:uncharacterized protein (DUF952 family)
VTAARPIFHLVLASELRAGVRDDEYLPARFAADGFVHCSGSKATALAVARDYFADAREPLVALQLAPARLRSKLVFEAPAPTPGAATSHLARASSSRTCTGRSSSARSTAARC